MLDTIVVGLGGMGSAAAHQIATRGKRVLGLDRYPPLHNRGSSHGTSRLIRQAYFESPAYVPLVLRAYELWSKLEHDSGVPLLTITGGLMIGPPGSELTTGSVASARQWGLPYEILEADEIRRRHPALTPDNGLVALYEPTSGFVHPEHCVRAHLESATAAGATLHFDEPVVSWEASSSVRVITNRGQYEAESLVLAPGAWAPELLSGLELPLTVERQVLYWFAPEGSVADAFGSGQLPVWVWEVGAGVHIYGFPAEKDSRSVKVAFYRPASPCSPDTIDRTVHQHEVDEIRRAMAGRIRGLHELVTATTCMYTTTPDHDFILGLHPRHENVVIASPCSGHGFKFASAIGEVLADLVIEGRSRHAIETFSPERFARRIE